MMDPMRPMVRVIGFRVEPTAVHWAVLEGTQDEPFLVATDRARAPLKLDDAATLVWYRSQAVHLIDKYLPAMAAIHPVDAFGQWAKRDAERKRARIEGALVAASHSKNLRTLTGVSASLSLPPGTSNAMPLLDSKNMRGLDWSGVPMIRREAILAATAALADGVAK